jgi:hypothetical protein
MTHVTGEQNLFFDGYSLWKINRGSACAGHGSSPQTHPSPSSGQPRKKPRTLRTEAHRLEEVALN